MSGVRTSVADTVKIEFSKSNNETAHTCSCRVMVFSLDEGTKPKWVSDEVEELFVNLGQKPRFVASHLGKKVRSVPLKLLCSTAVQLILSLIKTL